MTIDVIIAGRETTAVVPNPSSNHHPYVVTHNIMDAGAGEKLEAEVLSLLQTQRYDPDILPKLEEFVEYQVSHGFVDSGTNLAVLKLYQFYPERYNANIVAKILIKSLTSLPSTDFPCALYLIPERKTVDEPIPVIMRMQELLETGKFATFWVESGTCAELLASVPGAIDSIRQFMVSVIVRTYKCVQSSVLRELLNLNEVDLKKLCEDRKWTMDGTMVVIPGNEENQPRPRSMEESLSFRQVAAKLL